MSNQTSDDSGIVLGGAHLPQYDTFDRQSIALTSPRPILTLQNINKLYKTGELTIVLRNLNLEIEDGSFNVIRGESGSGKTSLLRIIGMLDGEFAGEYLFAGVDVKAKPIWYRDELRSDNIGFVFQDGQLFAHMTLRENVELPMRLHLASAEAQKIPEKISALAPLFFTELEMRNDTLSSKPDQVSGGQKQRAAIMRSVMCRPAVILADEPTASLDESRKREVLKLLVSLHDAGHTVIVVSHDSVFYETGRQLELSKGLLRQLSSGAPAVKENHSEIASRIVPSGTSIHYGWKPRASVRILLAEAIRESFLRPIFLFLILVSLGVGVCQIGVFSSVIVGAQTFLDQAMTRGSRLNRLEIKPRVADLEKDVRFPVIEDLKSWPDIQAIVPRRETIATVYGANGEENVYSVMGLHADDPEYRLLTFVAGGPFNPSNEELEVIVTVALLSELFANTGSSVDGKVNYADFIGRSVVIQVPQFARTGQLLQGRVRKVSVRIIGVILYAEGGRQLYLPNKTQLVFERYKIDRGGLVKLPLNEAGDAWSADRGEIESLVAFPWEDQLQVYTKEIRDIIPVFQQLSQLGYRPESEIWRFKWVLDIRDIAWHVFVPLLALITGSVGLTVATNLLTSAKLREREFALWRILGMRQGDLVITQVLSTIMMVLVGTGLGLLVGDLLVTWARKFLASQNPGAGIEKVFAPIEQFYLVILVGAIVVGIGSAIYPAIRTARADPSKVLRA